MKPYSLETHNGIITVINPLGQHRIFKIATQRADSNFAPGRRVVRLKAGAKFRGFAFVEHDKTTGRARIVVWKKKRSRAFLRFADILERPEDFQLDGYEYNFEGRCRVCNAPLTHPKSIELGIGPVCRKRITKTEPPKLSQQTFSF